MHRRTPVGVLFPGAKHNPSPFGEKNFQEGKREYPFLQFNPLGCKPMPPDFVYFVDGDKGIRICLVDGVEDAVQLPAGGDTEDRIALRLSESAFRAEKGGADIFLVEELLADGVCVAAHDEKLDLRLTGNDDFV